MKNKKTVIVTGAASGIGLACAKLLLERGTNVTAFDIQKKKMKSNLPIDDENLLQISGDVSDPNVCENVVTKTIKTFNKLDALIHWGAAHSSARWDELDADECNNIMRVNVTGTFLIAQAAAKPMALAANGAIVLCTSTSVLHGVTGGEGQGGPAYVASKGAIIALTRSLARALGPKGVRVNAVSPGITETAMIRGYSERQRDAMKQRFPLGRFAEPNEIAEAGIFLISEKASFMTGETMHVNGGSNFG
ncbi:MAG: SDR family NAD(P)-dependent oxidoreductase [Pseudomonadota bacterium]|nr:SDR family NAD(P)-dependent oxidoreductase [Pseudomonadota bacterium]